MLIERVEDDTYVIYLEEQGKNALFAIANNKEISTEQLLEFILIQTFAKLLEEIRQLKEPPPPSPGLQHYGPEPDDSSS